MITPDAAIEKSRPPIRRSSSTAWFSGDYPHPVAEIGVRAEGPYFTPADPSRYTTVICIVAGTGVSGAIAIIGAFTELKRQQAENSALGSSSGPDNKCNNCGPSNTNSCGAPSSPPSRPKTWERLLVIWSVRADDYIDLPFLKDEATRAPNLEVRVHLTGKGRERLNIGQVLADECGVSPSPPMNSSKSSKYSTWVYLSGPNAFIEMGEKACKGLQGVECFGAKWSI